MIKIELKNRRQPPVLLPSGPVSMYSPNVPEKGGVYGLIQAREKIISEMAKNCSFTPGQILIPKNPDDEKTHGECTLLHICKSYTDYGRDVDWPENNNPLILTVKTKDNITLFTTVNYFKAKQ